MNARLRRLPRRVRWLVAVPLAPAGGWAWLAGEVLLRLIRRGRIPYSAQDIALMREFAVWALRRGELWSAAFFARHVIAAEPLAPAGYYLLHRAALRAGKRAQARVALDRGLEVAPADTQLRLALAAFHELGQRGKVAAT